MGEMTEDQKLIMSLIVHDVSEWEYLEEYSRTYPNNSTEPEDIVTSHLLQNIDGKDGSGLEITLYLGFRFTFSAVHKDLLLFCMKETWHQRHQELVRALVSLLPKPNPGLACDIDGMAQGFYDCCLADWDYLRWEKEDDIWSLENDCMHALGKLGKLGDEQAVERLKHLRNSCNTQHISQKANDLIIKYGFK